MPKLKHPPTESKIQAISKLHEFWKEAGIKARDYQVQAIYSCLLHMGKEKYSRQLYKADSLVRELLVAPTGSGKTLMALSIAKLYYSLGLTVLFVAHRDRLLSQTAKTAKKLDMKVGFIAGGKKENRKNKLQIASFQTFSTGRELDWLQPDLVIADEAHYTSFTEVLSEYFPDLPSRSTDEPDYLGITATPMRLDPEESMGQKFNSVTIAPMPLYLINQGYLCGGRYYSVSDQKEGTNNCSLEYLYQEWRRLAHNRTTISFSNRVSRAKEIAAYFQSQGVEAACVHGQMSRTKREELYEQLENGQLKLLSSCLALNEGFDCPIVDAIIFDRRTDSLAAYIQSLGRGSRPCIGKREFVVLDTTGVVQQHGYLENLRITEECLSLNPERQKGAAPIKSCPNCGKYNFAGAKTCIDCGYTFKFRKKVAAENKPLVRMFWNEDEKRRYAYWSRLKVQAAKKFGDDFKLSIFWVNSAYYDEFGQNPPEEWEDAYFSGNK